MADRLSGAAVIGSGREPNGRELKPRCDQILVPLKETPIGADPTDALVRSKRDHSNADDVAMESNRKKEKRSTDFTIAKKVLRRSREPLPVFSSENKR